MLDLGGYTRPLLQATSPAQCTWAGPKNHSDLVSGGFGSSDGGSRRKSGAACGDVDWRRGQVLAAYHLDHLFVHSKATGLGLECTRIPGWRGGQKWRLEPGKRNHIEPGVYLAASGDSD